MWENEEKCMNFLLNYSSHKAEVFEDWHQAKGQCILLLWSALYDYIQSKNLKTNVIMARN